ncbi:MAG TPA: LemA family protein [Thermoanaerobaculia bacterium]|nr:LemA family protein [Thermoanaerobaculia bacterium]
MRSMGCVVGGAIAAVLVLVLLWGVGSYNGLVGSREAVESQWAQVESAYQRRADLIPNLVATVKGSAQFEQDTLTAVVQARSRVGQVGAGAGADILNSPEKFAEFQQAQDQLSSALSRLLVVVERYPDLKSTQAFRDLMVQLEGTENRINVERNQFNEIARDYNTRIQRFPGTVIASTFGFQPRPYFRSQPGAETAPKVDFGNR